MTVGFFGLTGPMGVLPSYFHRLIRRRLRARDRVFRDFLDIFNHRALAFFYRAWVKYRFPLAYERVRRGGRRRTPGHTAEPWPSRRAADDSFSRSLLALVGLGTQGQRGRHGHLEPVMLDFAGYFAHLPRTAIGLERILAEHFGLPIQVRQFQGQWLFLEAADRSHLGGLNRHGTANNRLGGNAVLGDGVWDVASRFRIQIGPLEDFTQFYRFLPVAVGDDLQVLRQLVRVYAGPDLEFDVQLVLPAESWLRVELGGDQERCPMLGWNVWLRAGPFDAENGDAVFSDEVLGGPPN